jgi:monoamine oxidase
MLHHPLVIIGAGLSGLTTAYRLKQRGIEAHVYEARNRVGGRILSVNINNHIGEMGAENVYDGGECDNILKLIEDLKLETQSGKQVMMWRFDTEKGFVSRTDALRQCKSLPREEDLEHRLTEIGNQSRNMADVLQALFPDDPTLRQIFELFLLGYEGAASEQLSTFYALSLSRWIESAYRSDDDPAYFDFMLIEGGAAQLPEKMRAALGDQVHLNMPLKALTLSGDRYLLRFANGQTVTADRVVLAMPCGTYKDITFDPQILPPDKLQHIQNVTYGKHSKILVPLDARSLPNGVYVNDRLGTFSFNPHLLTMYYVTEPQGFDPSHITQLFEHDRHFIKKSYQIDTNSQPPAVFAQDEHYGAYTAPTGYNWAADPYAQGSYSCIGVGQDECFTSTTQYHGETVKQLFQPIHDRLFFAGEHTSIITDGIGTMEAAVEAGEKTARFLAN